jgi:hypothetical protein
MIVEFLITFKHFSAPFMQAPNQPRRMMLIPVDIPGRLYPILMYGIFCLYEGPKLSFALSICVGYLYQKGYLDCIKPSFCFLNNLESPTGMMHFLSRSKGWVLAGAAIGHDGRAAVSSSVTWGGCLCTTESFKRWFYRRADPPDSTVEGDGGGNDAFVTAIVSAVL